MTLRSIYGHDGLQNRLEGALASGRFPQAAVLVGPRGVGKQRLALWIAQALLCTGEKVPCGDCATCQKVGTLSHPDLHWFIPIVRPKAGDPSKQVDEARELIGEALAERRASGLWRPPEGMVSHSLASVRLLQRVAAVTPFSAARKVIILGDAERLVVQEASQEAANALLKLLEEPPADTTLVLTVADVQGLLPTIRSRVVPIRVGRVTDEAVTEFLRREVEHAPKGKALEQRVLLAEGCIGRVVALDATGGDAPQRAAERFLEAVRGGPVSWSERVLAQPPWSARGDFSAMLDALALTLREELAEGAESADTERVRKQLAAVRRIETARVEASGNANPQLALAGLARELEHLL
jgi:DNA polymerase-3 subunit delta'